MKILLALFLLLPADVALAGSYRTTATHYSNHFVGKRMANGRIYRHNSNYVAHPTLRLGKRVKIIHRGRVVYGVVTDRCRCTIDLSKGLFRQLAPLKKGRINVKVVYN